MKTKNYLILTVLLLAVPQCFSGNDADFNFFTQQGTRRLYL